MTEHAETPRLPGLAPSGGVAASPVIPALTNLPFTDAQVDEFREQDRWLPVSLIPFPATLFPVHNHRRSPMFLAS